MIWELRLYLEIPVLTNYLLCAALRDTTTEMIGAPFDYLKNAAGPMSIHLPTDAVFVQHLRARYEQDPGYFNQVVTDIYGECNNLREEAKKIRKADLGSASRLELLQLLHEFLRVWARLAPFLPTVPTAASIVGEGLQRFLLEKGVPDREMPEHLLVLGTPVQHTRFERFHRQILRLAAQIQGHHRIQPLFEPGRSEMEIERVLQDQDQEIFRTLSNFTRRFRWLTLQFGFGSLLTFEDILAMLRGLIRADPEGRLRGLTRRRRRLREGFRKMTKLYSFSTRMIEKVRLFQELTFMRQYKWEEQGLTGSHLRLLLSEIAQRLHLNYDQACSLTLPELQESLEIGTPVVRENLIRERQRGYVMIMERGEIQLFSGEDMQPFLEEPEVDMSVEQLTGKASSQGLAIGNVTLVLNTKDFGKVRKGDVIVTRAVTPEYTAVAHRAAAVVSDIGGFTSHTAHYCRDMGIPLVSRTRIATKVLRDGERIKVDAFTGTVTRLSWVPT